MDLNQFKNENSSDNVDNITTRNNEINFKEDHDVWIVGVYFALQVCGGVMNLVHILALIRSRRNGLLSLILQITIVDAVTLYVVVNEILTLSHSTWYFSTEFCPFFKGTEVLLNTLTIYLLICFNFHVISLWNLHETEIKKNNKNPLTSCKGEDDPNECLVPKQESVNRFITIDYRKRKNDVSILFPSIFVWVVSLSLSIPNFTLSSTLKMKENYTFCVIVDTYYAQILEHSLLIFKVILPEFLLVLSLIIVIVKLTQTSKSAIENVLTKKMSEIRKLLIFCISLTVLYFFTSLQRHFLHFIHITSYTFGNNTIDNFKMPPLFNNHINNTIIVYLAMLHYSGCFLRGLLYHATLPKFSHLVRSKVFFCCKIKQ